MRFQTPLLPYLSILFVRTPSRATSVRPDRSFALSPLELRLRYSRICVCCEYLPKGRQLPPSPKTWRRRCARALRLQTRTLWRRRTLSRLSRNKHYYSLLLRQKCFCSKSLRQCESTRHLRADSECAIYRDTSQRRVRVLR